MSLQSSFLAFLIVTSMLFSVFSTNKCSAVDPVLSNDELDNKKWIGGDGVRVITT